MIKGRLGLKWRGSALVAVGVAVPVLYVALSGGPGQAPPKRDRKEAREAKPEAVNADDDGPPMRPMVRRPPPEAAVDAGTGIAP